MTIFDYSKIEPLESPDKIFRLSGKVGIITGGSGGMGRHFASVLIQSGAEVVLADISHEKCNLVCNEVEKNTGKRPLSIIMDASKEDDISKLFKVVEEKYNKLDFLINNLMGKPHGYYKSFEQYTKDVWDKVIDINLTGTFLCCQAAVKIMNKHRNGGSIVNTASTYGVVGPDQRIYDKCSPSSNIYGGEDKLNTPASYSASKAGLIGLTKYLATLCGKDNIRVNVLTPGGVFDGQEESFHEAYTFRVPLGRMATWTDYNGAILFLVSDASRYMTGQNLIVDGGWTAW